MTKVLVIEDNEKNRYLISFLLKGAGFEVIEAITGEEGIETAMRERPDLILMDIQLPGRRV
jgi:two-component system cell cycle response regulator DivK